MTDDAKEWVTVKLPKHIRDQAREHNPTYGELLTYGIHAYSEGLVGSNDNGDIWLNIDENDRDTSIEALVEELKNELSMTADPAVTPDVEGMMEKLERIESGVSTVEERTGRLDRRLSEMGGRQ